MLFETVISVILFVICYMLGKYIPKFPTVLWGLLFGVPIVYFFIYNNQFFRIGYADTIEITSLSLIVLMCIWVICYFGAEFGKQKSKVKTEPPVDVQDDSGNGRL